MAIESTEGGGFVVSGEADTRLYQIIGLKIMLDSEIRTGMKFSSKGSPFVMLKRLGIVPNETRTKRQGLRIVEEYLAEQREIRKAKVTGNDSE